MDFSLSIEEVSDLLCLIDPSVASSFEELGARFCKLFPPESHFKVCSALTQLVQQSDLLGGPEQELSVLYLLFHVYKDSRIDQNPFLALFVKLLNPVDEAVDLAEGRSEPVHYLPKLCLQGRYFLSQLVTNPSAQLLTKTPSHILSLKSSECTIADTSNLQIQFMEQQSEIPSVCKAGFSSILRDPVPATSFVNQPYPGYTSKEAAIELLTSDLLGGGYTMELIRIAPPLHLGEDTVRWITPVAEEVERLKPFWDESVCATNSLATEVKRLMMRALKNALTPNQQQQLILELQRDPKKIVQLGFTPVKLPDLVENNPGVAVEVLMLMVESNQITEYYSALVNMELSLHSMEVVNRLTTSTELPAEFIHQYVSNCISTCENIKDRYMQNRLVRLVCVFLSSLIRNKIIDVKELFIEVQAFCIEFSRIKEAASLFRLLKHIDAPEGVAASAVGSPSK